MKEQGEHTPPSRHIKGLGFAERLFKKFRERPRTFQDECEGVAYSIEHTGSKYTPWHLRFTDIHLPKYDQYGDGPHNNLVRLLFDNLLANEMGWEKPVSPTNYYGHDARDTKNITQTPGTIHIDNLADGNMIARKTILAYLNYRDRIDAAISEIERIYKIDPETRKSQDWGMKYSDHKPADYPDMKGVLLTLKEQFGLDYIKREMT